MTPTAYAQGTQTGRLEGRVVDSEGLPLPGVEVSLQGPQAQRRGTTDSLGAFRFPQLAIGFYEVRAELFGLTAERDAVRVYIDTTTEVELQLLEGTAPSPAAAPAARDRIQVTAVAPLTDPFETAVRTSVSREFLEELPVERFYQSVALLLPGVVGGEDGNPNTAGALRGSNLFLVDGVDTTDPTTGLFGLNLAYDGVDDVSVTTAAPAVDYGRSSGAVINVVTRSGGLDYRGAARLIGTSPGWRADYQDTVPAVQPEVDAANASPDDIDNTISVTLSGPAVRDRLFFFGVFEDGEESLTRPSLSGQLWDEAARIQSAAVKLDWQGARQSLSGQYTSDESSFGTFSVLDRSPGENRAARTPLRLRQEFLLPFAGDIFAVEERRQAGELGRVEWNRVVKRDVALTARVANQERRLTRAPRSRRGFGVDAAPHLSPSVVRVIVDPDTGELELEEENFALFNGITDEGREDRERRQANLAADLFFRWRGSDHQLRLGADYQRTRSSRQLDVSGADYVDSITGRDVAGQIFLDADLSERCLFLGECVGFDPVSGDFAPLLRLDFWRRPATETRQTTVAVYADDAVAIGSWLLQAGVRIEQVEGEDRGGRKLVDTTSISPRLAVKYDANGDGSVLWSLVYSRFHEAFPQRFLDDFSRVQPFSGYTQFAWAVGEEACLELDPGDVLSPCWFPDGILEEFTPVQVAPPNLDLDRAAVDELVFSFEKRLSTTSVVRLSLVDREWRDLWDDRLVLTGEDSFTAEVVNLPSAERSYRGLQLLVQRRFDRGWQLLGSYTWSETEGNLFQSTGISSFGDFTEVVDTNVINRFGFAPYDRTHQLKLFANYRHSFGALDAYAGSVVRFEDGTPFEAQEEGVGGVRFLDARGARRLEDFFQWDLSFGIEVPLPKDMRLTGKFEIFNVTDEQAQIGVETSTDLGLFAQPRTLEDIQQPRSYRVTLGFSF
ncbi:MAG: TonB-dependent receptor [Acidobacteriota bacterium]